MADVYVAVDPSVSIGGTDYVCFFNSVSLIPNQMMADIETFCDAGGERPGKVAWTFSGEVKQSFDTAGSWNVLRALAGTKVAFIVKPTDAAVAVTNPSATFNAWIPAIPFLDSANGEATTYTLECRVQGTPTFATS